MELHHLLGELLRRLVGETQIFRRVILGHGKIRVVEKTGIALQGTITDQLHRPQVNSLTLRQGPQAVLPCLLGGRIRPDTEPQRDQSEPQRRHQRLDGGGIGQAVLGKGNPP